METPKESETSSTFRPKRVWIQMGIIAAIAVAVAALLVYIFVKLAYCVSWVGAVLFYLAGLYWLSYEVCRLSVFPGSFWLWKRALERSRSAYGSFQAIFSATPV